MLIGQPCLGAHTNELIILSKRVHLFKGHGRLGVHALFFQQLLEAHSGGAADVLVVELAETSREIHLAFKVETAQAFHAAVSASKLHIARNFLDFFFGFSRAAGKEAGNCGAGSTSSSE